MPEAGAIYAQILLNLDSLKFELKRAEQGINQFAKNVNKSATENSKKMSTVWAASFALLATYGIRAARKITGAFKEVSKTFAEYEQALANTASVAQALPDELAALDAAARRVGATTRSTASQAANALYYLASAGFEATEAIGALDGVNALAIATQSDMAKTSELVATTIRQFNLDTSEATDVANTFTAAITNSLATMNKIQKSFEYVGPVAAGLGKGVEELTGALQLLYNKGFSGEKAGRALRRIFVDLADSTSIVNRRLQSLGITFDEVNPATNELAAIFETLRVKGVNAANASAIFGKISGAQMASLVSLSRDAAGGIDELTANITGTNRALEAMAIQMDTLKGSADQFRNAGEALKITIGQSLETPMRGLIDTGTEVVRKLNKVSPAILGVSTTVVTLSAGIAGLAIGIKAVLTVLASMGVAAGITAATLGSILIVITAVVGAIIILIATIRKLNKVRFKNWEEDFGAIKEAANIADEAAKEFYKSAAKARRQIRDTTAATLNDTEQLAERFRQIAEKTGLTALQVLEIAKAQNITNRLAGENLKYAEDILIVEQAKADLIQAEYDAEIEHRLSVGKLVQDGQALARQRALEQRQNAERAADAQRDLMDAFERATVSEALLGDEYDRNVAITEAFLKAKKSLINNGFTLEDDAVQNLLRLYDDLEKQYGAVVATTIDKNKVYIDTLNSVSTEIKSLTAAEKAFADEGIELDNSVKKSTVVMNGFYDLMNAEFDLDSSEVIGYIILWKQFFKDIKGENKAIDDSVKIVNDYTEKISKLTQTKIGAARVARDLALAEAEEKGVRQEAIDIINEYYDALDKSLAVDERKQREVAANISTFREYRGKLEDLGATEDKVLQVQIARSRALKEEGVYGYPLATKAVNAYFDALEKKTVLEQLYDDAKLVADGIAGITDAIFELVNVGLNNAIEAEDKALTLELDRIQQVLDATLEAEGLKEETTIERLQREYTEALRIGSLEEREAARVALRRQEYVEEAEDAKVEATRVANEKIADLEYKLALNNWRQSIIGSLINTALAVTKVLHRPLLAGAVAIAGGLQTVAIANQKPQPPQFQSGGIVAGSGYSPGTAVSVAENGSNEMLFNDSSAGAGFIQAFSDALAPALNRGGSMSARIYINETDFMDATIEIVEKATENQTLKINSGAIR